MRAPAPPPRSRWPWVLAPVVAVLALALWIVASESTENRWRSRYEAALARADRIGQEADAATALVERWRSKAQRLRGDLDELESEVATKVGDLDRPHFGLWNACNTGGSGCRLSPGTYYVGGVPDTFTYHVNFRSTVPVNFYIMTTDAFVCWDTGLCAWDGYGWNGRTQLAGEDFALAEGCAGYVAIVWSDQAGVFYPDISITRNPASTPTGICR